MSIDVVLRRIGHRIHEEMVDQHMNLKELSNKSGVSDKIISRLIKFRGNPGLKTLDKIATALNLSLEDLCNSAGKKSAGHGH